MSEWASARACVRARSNDLKMKILSPLPRLPPPSHLHPPLRRILTKFYLKNKNKKPFDRSVNQSINRSLGRHINDKRNYYNDNDNNDNNND